MSMQCESVIGRFGSSGSNGARPACPPSRSDRFPEPRPPAPRDGWSSRCRRWFDRAKSSMRVAPAAAGARPVSIAMVALSPSTEKRLRAACHALAALEPGCPVSLAQWNGQCPDVVIADSDDVYARLVCALAIRSGSRIVRLRVGPSDTGSSGVGSQVMVPCADDGALQALPHADLVELLARLCAEARAFGRTGRAPDAAMPELSELPDRSLLSQTIRQRTTGWSTSMHGGVCVCTNRMSSRIQAASPRHLDEAGRHLLSPAWRPVSGHGADASGVESRLDLFLLRACLSQQAALPRLDAAHFRLAHWPDLDGEEPKYAWVLPLMASVVRQAPVGVPKMAGHEAPPSGQINALFWAFWASGVLERVAMPSRGGVS